mgnify:FL=1
MIKSFDGKSPVIHPSAYVSHAALIIGDVEIGENCGIWPFAVLRGDLGKVKIGKNSHITEQTLITGSVDIGEGSIIGYGVAVESCKIGHQVFVGSHVTILGPSEIGNNAILGVNAVGRRNAKLPPHCLVTGVPAQVVKVLPLEECIKLLEESSRHLISLAKKYKEQAL